MPLQGGKEPRFFLRKTFFSRIGVPRGAAATRANRRVAEVETDLDDDEEDENEDDRGIESRADPSRERQRAA
jgi:hypothetical protein